MRRHQFAVIATLGISLIARPAHSQRPGGNRGMGAGMMGMSHDSATMALMMTSHQLVMNHDRIKRSVTNVPNGVRTVTESDDPAVAAQIKQHVASTLQRVGKGDDPGLPMETPALHAIFRNNDKVHTSVDTTANGVIVVQTSNDAATVAALQRHASEVSALVDSGMVAMHASMMQGRGMMMGSMHGDTAFAAMQQRGLRAMGVDQYTSTHHFDPLPDGGRIELQRDVDDSAGVAQIRTHLQAIVAAFSAGDFSTPAFVHMRDVPGATVMAAKRAAITYSYRELPRGGEVRIYTSDADALKAIHDFLAFQATEHHATPDR